MSVFDNLPSDSSLPDISMSDPGNTQAPNQSAGGKTKIVPTDMSGPSDGNSGYGFMTNNQSMQIQGGAPGNGNGSLTDNNGTGNSSGIPAAQPIDPLTYGDPNDSAIDHKDGFSPTGIDEERHGF